MKYLYFMSTFCQAICNGKYVIVIMRAAKLGIYMVSGYLHSMNLPPFAECLLLV